MPQEGKLSRAKELGKEAFEKGLAGVAAWDAEFMKLISTSCEIGESIPLLRAWNEGWHKANLASSTVGDNDGRDS